MSERAPQKANTAKNRRKQRLQACKSYRPHPQMEAINAMQPVLCKIERISAAQLAEIAAQRDKNSLTYARHCDILQMEPPKERFRRARNPKVGSTPNIAAPLLQIAPNNLQTPLNKTLIALGGSTQKIFICSPPRAEYAHRNSNVHGLKIFVVLIIFAYYQLFDNKISFANRNSRQCRTSRRHRFSEKS